MSEQIPNEHSEPAPFPIPRPRGADPAETPELRPDPFETRIDTEEDEEGPGGVRIDVDGGHVTGMWQDPYAPPGVARLGNLNVSDERKGKGTYLAGVFAREAIARGATALHSTIINPQAMRNRVRIFGEHNLTFVERRPDGSEWVLPMTSAQAVMSIKRAEDAADRWDDKGKDWPSDFDPGVGTRVNLMDPSVRIRIGLPPIAEGLDVPGVAVDAAPTAEGSSVAGDSIAGVRAEIVDNVELVRSAGDLVLGSSATIREALLELQAALAGTEAGNEVAATIQAALERAGISLEQLNTAIEELRRYDREIGQ